MLTDASWKALLAGATSVPTLASLAGPLGFGPIAPLDDATRNALGIPETLEDAHVAAGPGATRALLVVSRADRPMRENLTRLASKLTARAPHLLWLAFVAARDGETAIATWSIERDTPKVASLCVERSRILASDVETLAALAAAPGGNDLLLHGRWQELLSREALSRRFYRTLEQLVLDVAVGASGSASAADRRDVALLNVSRLLFLAFLETKGWLDGDRGFLNRVFDECMRAGGGFHQRRLIPLFFGTLNTRPNRRAASALAFGRVPFLNGGLFQRSASETRTRLLVIDDELWARVYDELLTRYRFTAREESGEWHEAAIDPEMLGRAFESLMVSRERRDSGAYFTPQPLVERITEAAFDGVLVPRGVDEQWLRHAAQGDVLPADAAERVRDGVRGLRILDPSCGSGAFLVHALERLTSLRRTSGDERPVHLIRREVLSDSIFGVDVNPTAVWLCELRLWLAVLIDHTEQDPFRVTPLPNLDHNIRCGDALAGGDFAQVGPERSGARVTLLRTRYGRATGARKRTLARALDREERVHGQAWLQAELVRVAEERRSLVTAARGRDLFGGRRGMLAAERDAAAALRVRAREIRGQLRVLANGGAVRFTFASHFPDVGAAGGFDVVIGNPPWVRLHRISRTDRERLRRDFFVYREAAWEAGARDARAGIGFSSQVDLASLFVERAMALVRPGGIVALLVPAKLWRSLAGGGMRRLLLERHSLRLLEDWSDAPTAFDAAVYPALVIAQRGGAGGNAPPSEVRVTAHRGTLEISWTAPSASIPLDGTRGAPWLVLPPDVRASFDRLARDGVSLVQSGVGQPTLGVKCGCNEAFLVRELRRSAHAVTVSHGARIVDVERELVRPVVRGENARPWRADESDQRIIYPMDIRGRPVPALPPGARACLLPFRRRLLQRADARPGGHWWSVFRTEAARSDRPRVVWADVGRAPVAFILPAGDRTVPINSCYVVRCRDLEDAFALAALLNSAIAGAWLVAIAEPARGGYRRFLAWTISRLPLPDDWHRARQRLAPMGERGFAGAPPGRGELLDAVLDAYRVRLATVSPLLGWIPR